MMVLERSHYLDEYWAKCAPALGLVGMTNELHMITGTHAQHSAIACVFN
jgi:hypothetical protein